MLWKTPGLQWQYLWANASIIRSIFWASPGKRKLHRNCLQTVYPSIVKHWKGGINTWWQRNYINIKQYLRAWTRLRSVNSWRSTKAWRTFILKSSLQCKGKILQTCHLKSGMDRHMVVVKGSPFSEIISYRCFVEAFTFVEELCDVLWCVSEQLIFNQKHNALQWQIDQDMRIELFLT